MTFMARKCCMPSCGEPTDCCEFWECAAMPSAITVTFTGTKTRNYANGQSLPIESLTWTITSTGTFSQDGEGCTRTYGCNTATLDWEYKSIYNVPNLGSNDTTLSLDHQECRGCDFSREDWCYGIDDVTYCALQTEHEHAFGIALTGSSINACTASPGDDPYVLSYRCGYRCDGECVAPQLMFKPSSAIQSAQWDTEWGCCSDDPDIDNGLVSFSMGGFSVTGSCGCPSAGSWADPRNSCTSGSFPFDFCSTSTGCEPINIKSTVGSGTEGFDWYCEDYANDIHQHCELTIDYTDTCCTQLTVSIS